MIRQFLLSLSASKLAKRGAEKRHQSDREKVRAKARQIIEELGRPADPRLA